MQELYRVYYNEVTNDMKRNDKHVFNIGEYLYLVPTSPLNNTSNYECYYNSALVFLSKNIIGELDVLSNEIKSPGDHGIIFCPDFKFH